MKDSYFYGTRTERLGYMKLSDWEIQPSPGLIVKRIGARARFCYDAAGVLQEAYSYDACLFVRLPDGTPVINLTKYGPTSEGHLTTLLSKLMPEQSYVTRHVWMGSPWGPCAHIAGAREVIGLGPVVSAAHLAHIATRQPA